MEKEGGVDGTPHDHQLGARSAYKAAVTVASVAAVGEMWIPFCSQVVKQWPPQCQRLHHTLIPRVGRATFRRTSCMFSSAQRVRTGMHVEFASGVPLQLGRVPSPASAFLSH